MAAFGKITSSLRAGMQKGWRTMRVPAMVGGLGAMTVAGVSKWGYRKSQDIVESFNPNMFPSAQGRFGHRPPPEGPGIAGVRFNFTRRK